MVSGEYPPMTGGVARYTRNLVRALSKRADIEQVWVATSTVVEKLANNNSNSSGDGVNDPGLDGHKVYGIIKKGDRRNSDRLLRLVEELKPDIVNIQYERGLYEIDTTVCHTINRILHGSTLDKFYRACPVPTVSTLHTVFPYEEYQGYIKERARRKEGRFGFLPTPFRIAIRKWVMERRYDLLLQVVRLSTEIISPAETIHNVVKRGTVIYHGAEPALLSSEASSHLPSSNSTTNIRTVSAQTTITSTTTAAMPRNNKEEFRKQFGLPTNRMLLLAFGYVGSYKGFDLLDRLELPEGWSIVVKQTRHERGVEKPLSLKKESTISLDLGYMDDVTMSKLLSACDAIIFPYRVVSLSGVMFDALAHGLPFVASDLEFFKEFAKMGLGITSERTPAALAKALFTLAGEYGKFKRNVEQFAPRLRWDRIAEEHTRFYSKCITCYGNGSAKKMYNS